MNKSRGEIISNAIITGLGFPLSIVMLVILLVNSKSTLEIIFNIFISIEVMLNSIFQVLYYSLRFHLFKILSYISFIIILTLLIIIICLTNISIISWVIFGISIGLCIINIIFSCININWFKYISFICNILLLIGFIWVGLLAYINNYTYIFLITCLILVLLFYYLYDNHAFMHYLFSVFILLLFINIYVFLLT